jgi:hypothetical protein
MSSRRITPNPDNRKTILFLAMLAIVLSGLFPPWLYTFDKSSTSDTAGGHWEVSAGYALLFKPPDVELKNEDNNAKFQDYVSNYNSRAGMKLDITRLFVEWVCILAVGGAAWGVVRFNRERISEANQKPQGGGV